MTAITNGKDFNLFEKITVTSATFTTEADTVINFRHQRGLSLWNMSGSTTVEYSFNGTTIHGELVGGTAYAGFVWENRVVSQIWLRITSGVSANVRVEAWAGA